MTIDNVLESLPGMIFWGGSFAYIGGIAIREISKKITEYKDKNIYIISEPVKTIEFQPLKKYRI